MRHGRIVGLAAGLCLVAAGTAAAWGADGHRMVGRVAASGLPSSMPGFFTDAVDQLAYLNPEPDRWRDRELRVMDEAFRYDHYIDLENVPEGALDATDRWEYLEALYDAGLEEPEQDAGFLPFRMLELYQRLVTGFARWRLAENPDERGWIEARVLNDAGILGHHVADAAQPHHSTIHYNGWASDAPNPRGFSTDRDIHWRFESAFVSAHITPAELGRAVPSGVQPVDDVRAAIFDYVQATNDEVVTLYELEQRFGFDPDAPPAPETEAFVLDRLATATVMLRSLWYAAWRESEGVAERFAEGY